MLLAHWKRMPNESKGEQGGPCNWRWIKAKKFTCLIFPPKLGTALKTTTTSATIRLLWSLGASSYHGVSTPPPTLHQSSAVVDSRDLDQKTREEIQALFKPYLLSTQERGIITSGTEKLSFVKKS